MQDGAIGIQELRSRPHAEVGQNGFPTRAGRVGPARLCCIRLRCISLRGIGLGSSSGGGVVERPQQPGHVPHWAGSRAALFHGARRLALKVDKIGVGLHHQNLAQVEIAMNAGVQRAGAVRGQLRR